MFKKQDTQDIFLLCVICIEECNIHDNIITLNCNHLFHDHCIRKYIAHRLYNVNCPLCRNPINKKVILSSHIKELQTIQNEITHLISKIKRKLIWYSIKNRFSKICYNPLISDLDETLCELYFNLSIIRNEKREIISQI